MPALIDAYQRPIQYIRLSVTDQCDLRCLYCIPEGFKDFQEPEEWLNFEEIERLAKIFTNLGVNHIRLTGGEPLVRRNLAKLAGRLSRIPQLNNLSLSTNASRLKKQATDLYDAGVQRINVSLDSLNPERFKQITGGKLDKVLGGLFAAKAAGFTPIKINMVVMQGINDDEIEAMLAFCTEHQFILRFIETMPMGETGRIAAEHFVSVQTIQKKLSESHTLLPAATPKLVNNLGPAKYMKIAETGALIGFITPISDHFCATCNRLRLSADGTLYFCLGQDDKIELRPLLRNNISDAELEQHIRNNIYRKPERHEFREKPNQIIRFMSTTGG